MGSYSGSNSLSMSTPSLLFGRSMTWPLEASTRKSLPRNLVSVLDLVGDSTITRGLPLALSPSAASSSASSTSGSGSGAAPRPLPRTRAAAGAPAAMPAGAPAAGRRGRGPCPSGLAAAWATRLDASCAGLAGLTAAGFTSLRAALAARGAGAPAAATAGLPGFFAAAGAAAASVRDFLVAMCELPGAWPILDFHRHARRHLAGALHLDRALAERGECLEHALELVRIERAARPQFEQVAPRLGGERVALLRRQHALGVPVRESRDPAAGRGDAREPADAH